MPASTSTAVTVGPGRGERDGERAEARSDLEHMVPGADPR